MNVTPNASAVAAMSRTKARAAQLLAHAKVNGYQRGARREKDQARDAYKYVNKTDRIKIHVVSLCTVRAPSLCRLVTSTALTQPPSWHRDAARKDCSRTRLPAPDEATVRERCLAQGVTTPSVASIKISFASTPPRAMAKFRRW
jgi:hypothetical protein